jgi:type II secretory pathway pseudopilin PulG
MPAGHEMDRGSGGEHGLSLLEVLAAALLLGVLLMVAIPRLLAPPELDVGVTARRVAADLRLAQRLAISGRASYTVAFDPVGGPYTSYAVARQGGTIEPDYPKAIPAGVSVAGVDQVTFTPSGAASPPGTITFTVSAGGATARVDIVAATGRVQVTPP